MKQDLKIERIFRSTHKKKNADGTGGEPYKTKDGRPFTKLSIFAREKWYNGFDGPMTKDWEEGQVVEVEVTERTYEGRKYYDFRVPKVDFVAQIKELLERVKKLEEVVYAKQQGQEINIPDINLPF